MSMPSVRRSLQTNNRVLGFFAAVAVCWVSVAFADEPTDLPPADAVKPELFASGFAFAEGPAFDSAGNLYVVNYQMLGTIGRVAPNGTASVYCDLRQLAPLADRSVQANGLKVDRQGCLIAADMLGGQILRVSQPDVAKPPVAEVLADSFEGKRLLSPNDLVLNSAGIIYFTDSGNYGWPDGALYRLNPETRELVRIDAGLQFANGVAISPDQKQLCVAESKAGRVLIYDLLPDGRVANRRVLADFPDDVKAAAAAGDLYEPDGIAFDAAGRLYVVICSHTRGVINVLEVPSGKVLRQYDTGGPRATNCCFRDGYLYTTVSSQKAVFRLKLGVGGFDSQTSQP